MDPRYASALLVGGAGSIDACQRRLLARSVLPAWGEPARPLVDPPLASPMDGRLRKPWAGMIARAKEIKDGRHVGLDFYDLLIA